MRRLFAQKEEGWPPVQVTVPSCYRQYEPGLTRLVCAGAARGCHYGRDCDSSGARRGAFRRSVAGVAGGVGL